MNSKLKLFVSVCVLSGGLVFSTSVRAEESISRDAAYDLHQWVIDQGYEEAFIRGEMCACDPDTYTPVYYLEGEKCKKQYCKGGDCVPVIHPKPQPMDKGLLAVEDAKPSDCKAKP